MPLVFQKDFESNIKDKFESEIKWEPHLFRNHTNLNCHLLLKKKSSVYSRKQMTQEQIQTRVWHDDRNFYTTPHQMTWAQKQTIVWHGDSNMTRAHIQTRE